MGALKHLSGSNASGNENRWAPPDCPLPIWYDPCVLAFLPLSSAFQKDPDPASWSTETQRMTVTYESLRIPPLRTCTCRR